MPTSFQSFNPGDLIEDSHVEQFIAPIQALESGASQYRQATNTGNAYKVSFASGSVVTGYTPGQVVHFKAPAANTGAATLTITGPSGDLAAIDLVKDGGDPLVTGDILQDQVISAIYTEDAGATNPRFEVIGGLSGKQDKSEKGQVNGYAGLDVNGKVPAAQLPSASGGTPAWGDITGSVANQPDLYEVFSTKGFTDVMEWRVIPGSNSHHTVGMPVPTGQGGTYVARTPADGTAKTRMRRVGFTGSSSTVAGMRTTAGAAILPGHFSLTYHFALSDPVLVSGARMFIGLSNLTAAATNVDPATLTQCIGVAQLSTDPTQFYLVWGTTTGNSEALGVPFDLDAVYRLQISSDVSGSFDLRLTNLVSGSSATVSKSTGPLSSTALLFRFWRTSNGSGSTSGIENGNLFVESLYG